MLAFSHLHKMLKEDELRMVYRVMGEKELRVHIDLDDVLEGGLSKAEPGDTERRGSEDS